MSVVRIVVCVIVGFFGFLAFVFGIAGESLRVKATDLTLYDSGTCGYGGTAAAGLGIVGSLLILVAQIVANAFGGCVCCCDKNAESLSSRKRSCAILCLVFSWICTITSLLLLMIFGAANTAHQYKIQTDQNGDLECTMPPAGGLAAGGVLALVAAFLATIFYGLVASKSSHAQTQRGGAAVELYSAYPAPYPNK